jgi:hypothetical protein
MDSKHSSLFILGGSMQRSRHLLISSLCLLVACAPKADSAKGAASDSTPSVAPAGAPAVPMKAEPMMAAVHAHIDSLAAQPQMLHGEMSAHTAMVMGLVDAMKSDLATVGYNDPGYQALADSVVQDLSVIPNLSGAAAMKAEQSHLDRVRRLMAAYEGAVRK